ECEVAVAGHRRRPPVGRFRYHLYLDRLSLEGQRRLEVEGGRKYLRRVAGGYRRQGQRGRRQQRAEYQGLDRLCRICLCQAEQVDDGWHGQQGWQNRRAEFGCITSRGSQRKL